MIILWTFSKEYFYLGLWLDCMFGEGQSVESCTTYGDYVQLRCVIYPLQLNFSKVIISSNTVHDFNIDKFDSRACILQSCLIYSVTYQLYILLFIYIANVSNLKYETWKFGL